MGFISFVCDRVCFALPVKMFRSSTKKVCDCIIRTLEPKIDIGRAMTFDWEEDCFSGHRKILKAEKIIR